MTKKPLTDEERKQAIEEFARKKRESAKADAPAPVKPTKPPPTKIPKEKNLVNPKAKADEELDESVKPKPKKERDASMLTVSEIAAELGVDPKRARARLRSAGKSAVEGRWPTAKRDSKEHKELAAIIKPDDE